jgi:hypothetical protein
VEAFPDCRFIQPKGLFERQVQPDSSARFGIRTRDETGLEMEKLQIGA